MLIVQYSNLNSNNSDSHNYDYNDNNNVKLLEYLHEPGAVLGSLCLFNLCGYPMR